MPDIVNPRLFRATPLNGLLSAFFNCGHGLLCLPPRGVLSYNGAMRDTTTQPISQQAAEDQQSPGESQQPGQAEQSDAGSTSRRGRKRQAAAEAAEQAEKPELTVEQLQALSLKVEAALLTTDRPLPAAKLADVMEQATAASIRDAISLLNKVYEQSERSFRIEEVAGGYQLLTLPQFADVLSSLHRTRGKEKLSTAALETLAIVAYKQPIVRAEIENIRGVACGEVLRSLMERHLIKIVGRAEELGRPMLYGTTKSFLEVFGLSNLKDLPKVEDFKLKDQ